MKAKKPQTLKEKEKEESKTASTQNNSNSNHTFSNPKKQNKPRTDSSEENKFDFHKMQSLQDENQKKHRKTLTGGFRGMFNGWRTKKTTSKIDEIDAENIETTENETFKFDEDEKDNVLKKRSKSSDKIKAKPNLINTPKQEAQVLKTSFAEKGYLGFSKRSKVKPLDVHKKYLNELLDFDLEPEKWLVDK